MKGRAPAGHSTSFLWLAVRALPQYTSDGVVSKSGASPTPDATSL
uniref:Uncharacterized protein n=1 Tax=Triticum urartu TaxID=4572 RepID=A0A8R7NXZ4_TRIUA